MDAQHFDALARVLSTGHRRGLLGALLTLPVLGGLAGVIAIDEANAQRGKGQNGNNHDDVAADKKNKNKRRKKQCKQKKAKACDGRCGTVTVKCKTGKKTKKKRVACGSCACEPACEACFLCDEATETCAVDPAQQGDPCGATGQVCQADGACACEADSCPGGSACQPDGACSAVCGGEGCFDGDSCEPGTANAACGTGGEACVTCTGNAVCEEGECVAAPCTVCASGCPFSSVQAAIAAADPGATITVCAGTYQEGEILIAKDLTLIGAGEGQNGTILDGQGQHRVLGVVAGVTVDLQGLRLTGGGGDFGGGLSNQGGQLTLTGCTVIDNAAAVHGGGLYTDNTGETILTACTVSGNTAGRSGGGIHNAGSLTLTDSTVSDNTANDFGGGIGNEGTLTLTGCTVRGNTANDFFGGGIGNFGTVTLTDSTVRDNTANDLGGGIFNTTNGTVSLAGDSQVCENTADGQPSNCDGFTPPADVCAETCPA